PAFSIVDINSPPVLLSPATGLGWVPQGGRQPYPLARSWAVQPPAAGFLRNMIVCITAGNKSGFSPPVTFITNRDRSRMISLDRVHPSPEAQTPAREP